MLSMETNEMFIGFNSDTTASLILNLTRHQPDTFDEAHVLLEAKKCLLQCATPDSIMRVSSKSRLDKDQREFIWNEYFLNQKHLALDQLMNYHFSLSINNDDGQLVQITTHSKSTLLTLDMDEFKNKIGIQLTDVCLLNTFDTQTQFVERVRNYYVTSEASLLTPTQKSLMLVQIELARRYDNDLLSCVRHLIVDIRKEFKAARRLCSNPYIAILVIVPRENVRNVSGFQLGKN